MAVCVWERLIVYQGLVEGGAATTSKSHTSVTDTQWSFPELYTPTRKLTPQEGVSSLGRGDESPGGGVLHLPMLML